MAADQQRLGLVVGDTGDTDTAAHLVDILFELGTERRVFYVVDLSLEAQFPVIHGHAAAACTQMRMIVYAVVQIVVTLLF